MGNYFNELRWKIIRAKLVVFENTFRVQMHAQVKAHIVLGEDVAVSHLELHVHL